MVDQINNSMEINNKKIENVTRLLNNLDLSLIWITENQESYQKLMKQYLKEITFKIVKIINDNELGHETSREWYLFWKKLHELEESYINHMIEMLKTHFTPNSLSGMSLTQFDEWYDLPFIGNKKPFYYSLFVDLINNKNMLQLEFYESNLMSTWGFSRTLVGEMLLEIMYLFHEEDIYSDYFKKFFVHIWNLIMKSYDDMFSFTESYTFMYDKSSKINIQLRGEVIGLIEKLTNQIPSRLLDQLTLELTSPIGLKYFTYLYIFKEETMIRMELDENNQLQII